MNTTHWKNIIAGHIFNTKTDIAMPTTFYIGLSTSPLAEDGTGVTEVSTSGTNYSRIEMTGLSVPENGILKNTSDLMFPRSLIGWSTSSTPITDYVIYDAKTGGNALCGNALQDSKIIQKDTTFVVEPNGITLSVI